jgi:hypothetical protein
MKNKKILTSLGVIAALLIVYAVASRKDRGADLPRLEKWTAADEILITRGNETLRIHKKDGRWLLGDAGFPADKSIIDKLEEKLRDLVITDISSEKPHYERFELAPEEALRVTVKGGGAVLRDVYLGKKSSKTSHTFIRLAERPEVFKASGMLKNDFDRKAEDLRDKVVFDVKREDVDSFEITYRGRKTALIRVKAPEKKDDKKPAPPATAGKMPVPPREPDKWFFAGDVAKAVDINAVNAVIGSFGPLRARSFPDLKPGELRAPLCTVRIAAAGKTHELVIYQGREKDIFPCTSPGTPYVFDLQKYSVERYFREAKDFNK